MHRRHTKWILLTLALALVLAGWFALNRFDGEQDEPRAPLSTGSNSWQAQLVRKGRSLQRDPARRIWPFSATRGPAEFMPLQIRQAAKATLGKGQRQLGLRFEGAQYLDTPLGIGMWVVKGRGVTCIFHERKALAACNVSVDVGRRGLTLVAGARDADAGTNTLPTRFLALGIAPDWARAVRLQIVGGGSKTIPVIDNAYALRARAPINVEGLIR